MSVTKAELIRINEHLQETIRALLHENKALRCETATLNEATKSLTQQIECLSVRYQKLSDYMKRLHNWLHDGKSKNEI